MIDQVEKAPYEKHLFLSLGFLWLTPTQVSDSLRQYWIQSIQWNTYSFHVFLFFPFYCFNFKTMFSSSYQSQECWEGWHIHTYVHVSVCILWVSDHYSFKMAKFYGHWNSFLESTLEESFLDVNVPARHLGLSCHRIWLRDSARGPGILHPVGASGGVSAAGPRSTCRSARH